MLVAGYRWGGRLGLFIGFISAVGFIYFLFRTSDSWLLRRMRAYEVLGQDPWNLNDLVVKWSHKMAIAAPRVFLIDRRTPTAFSLGQPWGFSSICLSTELLKKLSTQEIEAVLIHQICHILRRDTFAFGLANSVANSLLALAEMLDAWWPLRKFQIFHQQRPFRFLFAPLGWFFIRLTVRDRNYFENDDWAAHWVGDKNFLAQTLWKIEALNQSYPLHIPDCSGHLFIVNPRGLGETHWFYNTHPRMSLRLKRLTGSEVY